MRARRRGYLLVAIGGILGLCAMNLGCRMPGADAPEVVAKDSLTTSSQGTLESGFTGSGPKPASAPSTGAISRTSYQPVEKPMDNPPCLECSRRHGPELPTELVKVSHPPYVIEPPDILLIDTVRFVPRPPFRIEPTDVILIQAAESLPNQPIAGPYVVSPAGTVNLGFVYGTVNIAGLTLEQAEAAVRTQLAKSLKNPQVSMALAQSRGVQQTRGEHLVRQDGTISLGTYGCVYVAGLTTMQAKQVIEEYLSKIFLHPEVSVDVLAYNSKCYYIIADGAGYGQQVFRFPITGNETVLDAISQIGGLPIVASKRKIWVARPTPAHMACNQILPVDWMAITQGGSTATNYQLFPGDRIYVKADCLICFDNWLDKVLRPVERVFGVTLLGNLTARSFGPNNNNGVGGF